MNTDAAYALKQLQRAQQHTMPRIVADCVQRAIDALERIVEADEHGVRMYESWKEDQDIAHGEALEAHRVAEGRDQDAPTTDLF